MSMYEDLLADHSDEVAALDTLLSKISEDDWLKPTPAEGWDVRDSVAHLAVGDEMALECVLMDRIPEGMTRGMEAVAAGLDAMATFEQELVERGRVLEGPEVYSWWRTGNVALGDALAEIDLSRRLHWGPNLLSPASFVTARLMETWAHGLDCFDALGIDAVDTARLKHVALLGLKALPYAFMVAGIDTPGAVQLRLRSPSGEEWTLGDPGAPTVIEATAGDWCRVAVRRDRRGERDRLRGSGPDAENVIAHVRAYL
jgi:uncharacterized protein (TIGR03084 family)